MLTILKTRASDSVYFDRNAKPQIFDLLQLSKKESEYRKKFIELKRELYRPSDEQKKILPINETILRRRVQNAALCYRFVRRERIRLFRDYIDRLPKHEYVTT
jgi:hypothetical protein